MFDDLRHRLRRLAGRVITNGVSHKDPSGTSPGESTDVALVLSGGGARASYQAGVLEYVAETFPQARFSIVTGVSAGAINAAHLANHRGPLGEAANRLVAHWEALTNADVYTPESGVRLLWAMLRGSDGSEDNPSGQPDPSAPRGLMDTAPLRAFLEERLEAPGGVLAGIGKNLADGDLKAAALTTTNYATGQSVTFVQGRDFDRWERPNRISRRTRLGVDHVMASASLPLMFPAIQIGDAWYGDGGVRLSAPLAPAIHLGADRVLAISTRYERSHSEAATPATTGYPPPAQIIGSLMNAVFLDALDQDTFALRRINRLIEALPPGERHGMRPVKLLTLRPSVDLGRLAGDYEASLPMTMRVLLRALGIDQTESPDWLSMMLFEHEYVARLIDIGYRDASRHHDDIAAFFDGLPARKTTAATVAAAERG